MSRRLHQSLLACVIVLAACGVEAEPPSEAAGADAPAISAAARQPAVPAGGMAGEELDALAEAATAGLDGGDHEQGAPESTADFGPGLSSGELASLVAPLAEAEAWLAELEVQWDNGMTYSEIFRAWRSVSVETGPALASFAVPPAADESQVRDLSAYYESVQGAHDEWQATVDFIVTYITNYTPEILITKAYQEVEVHLRDAAAVRQGMGIADPVRPQIVLEELVDL